MYNFVSDIWQLNDPRLPTNDLITRVVPEADFIASMAEGQLHPITMGCTPEGEWRLIAGRRRLLAKRILAEANGDNTIWVAVVEGVSHVEMDSLALQENAHRSSNPISDYLAIREILQTDRNATYKTIAAQIHATAAYVKCADLKFAEVPKWALEAVLDSKMAETTAIAVGKLNKVRQKEAQQIIKETGKLPMSAIKTMKRAVQNSATASMMSLPGVQSTNKRQFFARTELEELSVLLEKSAYSNAKKLLAGLLSQEE